MKISFSITLLCLFFVSCTQTGKEKKDTYAPIKEFNLIKPAGLEQSNVSHLVFQSLLFNSNNGISPLLAEAMPLLIKTPEGGLLLTFSVRQEANWDNGKPVGAKDVEYSFKLARLWDMLWGNARFSKVKDFKFYDNDFRKFTFVYQNDTSGVDALLGSGFMILPADTAAGFIANRLSLEQINDSLFTISPADSAALMQRYNRYNVVQLAAGDTVSASGAYRVVMDATEQAVCLLRKPTWWADGTNSSLPLFTTSASVIKIR